MLKLRADSSSLNEGDYMSLPCITRDKNNQESVFCYMRGKAKTKKSEDGGSERFVVIVNLGTRPRCSGCI